VLCGCVFPQYCAGCGAAREDREGVIEEEVERDLGDASGDASEGERRGVGNDLKLKLRREGMMMSCVIIWASKRRGGLSSEQSID